MRYLERSILLQVIDNRWREHLFDMDYLREGIHLRGFAQIDPLVAYKNEGFCDVRRADALDLGGVQRTDLPRRGRARPGARPQRQPAAPTAATDRRALDYSGGTLEAQPSALEQVAAAGRRRDRDRGRRRRHGRLAGGRVERRQRRGGRDRGQRRARQNRPQRPVLVWSAARSTRSATGLEGLRRGPCKPAHLGVLGRSDRVTH